MSFLGVGEIIGAFGLGCVRDRYGNKWAMVLIVGLMVISIAMLLIFNKFNKFNQTAYLMTLTWGLQDSSLNCFINCILGFEFKSKIAPFAVFRFIWSISIFIF